MVSTVNDPLVAAPDAGNTSEDAPLEIEVLANDVDVDGDVLHVDAVAGGDHGTTQVDGSGRVTYTPAPNFNGMDSFTYTVSDGKGSSDVGTVSVTVLPVNDAPVAVDDAATTPEDVAVNINVRSNDLDVDGDVLELAIASGAAHGAAVINETGTVTYTPAANYHGPDSFGYLLSDGQGGSATGTVSLTVVSVNDAPVAMDDVATTPEDQGVTVEVMANDSDVDGDRLRVLSASPGTKGLTVVNEDGTVTYTPRPNLNGSDSFTYTLGDGLGYSVSAQVSVSITAVNDVPVAVDDATLTPEDVAVRVAVLANDSDVEGEVLQVIVAGGAIHGVAAVNGDGVVTYTPAPNFNGTDSFTYTISDGNEGSATGTVRVTVVPVNDAPVAVADVAATPEDQAVTVSVFANDSDVDGDALVVSIASTASHGALLVNEDGAVTYTPDANFHGSDSFTYGVGDGNEGNATATVNVTVVPVNDVPVAAADVVSTDEDVAVAVEVLNNDSDVDGDVLSVSGVTQGSAGGQVGHDGRTVTYRPTANFNGNESFTYTVSDGSGATTTATVNTTVIPMNDAPVAGGDLVTTAEDTPVTVEVLGNDGDVDGEALVVSIAGAASHGELQVVGNTVRYTPAADFNGPDRFTYTASDGNGGSATAAVQVTVTAVNDAPVAADDATTTDEDTPATLSVLGNDRDVDGDPLRVLAVGAGSSAVVNQDGTLTYTPPADFNGSDSFTYTVGDGNGGTDTGTVTVTVAAVNDAPVAVNDVAATVEDLAVTVAVLANDSDVDGDGLGVSAFSGGAQGTLVLGADGRVVYTPVANFNGPDSFTYTVSDGNGGTDTGTVTVTVAAVNDAPVAVDDAVNTDEDTPVQVDVLANDRDVDGNQLVAYSLVQGKRGTAVLSTDGQLRYIPNTNFNGADTLGYTASDGQGGSDIGRVVVKVKAVNDVPVANDDLANTLEDTPLTLAPLANDLDADGEVLVLTGVSQGLHGTVTPSVNGSVVYTPAPNFNGSDSFTYTISDGNGGTDTGAVNLTLAPVNDAPVASAGVAQTVDEGASVSLAGSGSDVDGGMLGFQWTQVGGPTVILSGASTATPSFTAPQVSGTMALTFQLVVTDQGGLSSMPAITTVSVRDRSNAANWLFLGVKSGAAAIQPKLRNEDIIRFSRDAQGKVIPETVERFFDGSQFFKSDEALDAVEVDNFDSDAELEMVFSVRSKANIKMEGLEIRPGDLVRYNPSASPRFSILLAGSALFRDYQGNFAKNRENIDGVAIQQLSATLWKVFLTTTSNEQIGSLSFDHNDVVQVDYNPTTKAVSNPVKVLDAGSLFRGKDADIDGLEVADEDGNGTMESVVFSTSSAERLKDGRAVRASVLYGYNQELKTTEELFDPVADGLSRGRPGLSNVAALGSLKPWGTGPKPGRLAKEAVAAQVLPQEFGLTPNYPNPFNPATTIGYHLGEAAAVRLRVYDVLGQQIKVLVDQPQVPGSYEVKWEGVDESGRQVGTGIYLYRLEAGPQVAVGKMLLVR